MLITKEECKKQILDLAQKIDGSLTIELLRQNNLFYPLQKYWGSLTKFKDEFNLTKKQTFNGKIYTKEELIKIMNDFYYKTGIIPTSKFMDLHNKEYGLPSRKTFTNKFECNWYECLLKCGINPDLANIRNSKEKMPHDNKQFLIDIIYKYIDEKKQNPTLSQLGKYYGIDLKKYYEVHFGGWNNCLKELGITLNSVTQYTEKELDFAFLDFVEKYNRVPTIQDFNKTDRPSFWCYQNRFGSWAETCIHYGFKPNNREIKYYMSDGERCDSSYEYDVSTWLKSKGIKYDRDIPYKQFIENYNGKMNCDYRFILNDGQIWYVEIAGFINTYDFSKLTSREEEIYYFKLKYKIKMFKKQNLNYLIIHPKDLKSKALEDIFFFLNIQKTA